MMKAESMNNRNMRTIPEPQGCTHNCAFYSCGSNVPIAPHVEDIRGNEAFIFFSPTVKGYENGNCFGGGAYQVSEGPSFQIYTSFISFPAIILARGKRIRKKTSSTGGSAGEDHAFGEELYPTPQNKLIWKAI